ncbi:MAG: hypothetical protein IKG18_18030 [Atopobiaceae bacterium]|nr:hypothetical protein [Atopobiaceae bacterium]
MYARVVNVLDEVEGLLAREPWRFPAHESHELPQLLLVESLVAEDVVELYCVEAESAARVLHGVQEAVGLAAHDGRA